MLLYTVQSPGGARSIPAAAPSQPSRWGAPRPPLPGLLRDTAAFLPAWELGGLGHEDEEGAGTEQQPERAWCPCLSEIANPCVAEQASLNKERFLSLGCPV